MPNDAVSQFNEILVWVTSGGGAAIIASFILERLAWFQAQTSEWRRVIFALVSAALGLGSYAVIQFVPPETLNAIAPWFLIAISLVVPILTGTVAHTFDPANKPKG